ncbi:pyridoxamine 5'-phosphate oxidase family protein [Pectinatus haikarae]|uniref:Nitroimidazol reductase NimA-like FMN-containing flavoprotein (Pyridoxamine 5'-phosphate oxidase superfamily) n=1 Tax=Pectinatus haikarae TaxID=349096 RepID=A0ABT9Y3D7_9FIRM|nr:pyridoxamine 5'-phosphate oxidase family protein [Pectinatus haikarae]MDQ0202345.1 nitroimidazol reductase NimA-like FMN-containing flavoprotein (pyridoxamine 5'-phosphate oxidase superfamily) [Pectinatus haikarae]
MRRIDREITDLNDIIRIMKDCKVCHVAFHDEEYPYVVPMTFGLEVKADEINIYFHGAKVGKKHDLIRRNNKVSFVMENICSIVTGPQVGECECTMEFESVMGTGIIEYVPEERKTMALQTMLTQYGVKEGKADYHFHCEVVPKIHLLCLRINSLSAKRRDVAEQKYIPPK